MKPELPKSEARRGMFLPRWVIPIVWAIIVLVLQILLPWAISWIGPRFGWSGGGPGLWNNAGLIAVIIGIGMYAWCLVFHFRSYRSSVRVGFSPPHLVIAGPYQISRNPMYVSAMFAWLGWVVYFGSPAVLIALILLWSIFAFRVIPLEERQLGELFGEEYLQYKRLVSRWIGRRSAKTLIDRG